MDNYLKSDIGAVQSPSVTESWEEWSLQYHLICYTVGMKIGKVTKVMEL